PSATGSPASSVRSQDFDAESPGPRSCTSAVQTKLRTVVPSSARTCGKRQPLGSAYVDEPTFTSVTVTVSSGVATAGDTESRRSSGTGGVASSAANGAAASARTRVVLVVVVVLMGDLRTG